MPWGWSHLVYDVDPIVELLPLEEGVQVIEEELEVVFAVPVGDDDGRAVPGLTAGRPVPPPPHHQGVLPLHLRQSQARREAYMDGPT